eukprot:scaffold11149_cov129-Isochrysis_galbana.AAC.3
MHRGSVSRRPMPPHTPALPSPPGQSTSSALRVRGRFHRGGHRGGQLRRQAHRRRHLGVPAQQRLCAHSRET